MKWVAGFCLAIILTACHPVPESTVTNLVLCDTLRSGATVEEEIREFPTTYERVEQAVNETCPEFAILLEDYRMTNTS